jgi:alpha-mannosidase
VADVLPQGTRYALVHPGGQPRPGSLVRLPEGAELDDPAAAQRLIRADGSSEQALLADVPATSVIACGGSRAAAVTGYLEVTEDRLENELIRARLDRNGELVSVFDKRANRELLKPGTRANRLVAYEDKPVFWDSWDVDWYFDQKSWPVEEAASISVVERGPLRAAIRIERRYRQSRIVQIVSLEADAALIEFDCFVDWRERQTLLKAGFDFDLNANSVDAEIQFGHVTRPTHFNTSWDRARFEASMHRWVAMHEGDYAVGLVNDCKYAYDAKGQSLRLTLIKSGTYPFDGADQEEHRFRYGLTVASGDTLPTIANRAAEFSAPLYAIELAAVPAVDAVGEAPRTTTGLVSIDAPNVAISAVKPADDGRGIIIRLFEQANRRARLNLAFGFDIATAYICSMTEEEIEEIRLEGASALGLELRPFEIVTLRVLPVGRS